MIPRCYPTDSTSKMKVYAVPSITGLKRYSDYIPVKTATLSTPVENTYAATGYIRAVSVGSITGLVAWKDYVPVWTDASATVPWSTNANGYIPINAS